VDGTPDQFPDRYTLSPDREGVVFGSKANTDSVASVVVVHHPSVDRATHPREQVSFEGPPSVDRRRRFRVEPAPM
jgi:hypothetical protein